uniref:Uncharacterized protein n=1 Tax=Physcomitrium patens TaxID=3218 RepID=A0A2K1JIT4_PHYPA|nr:hypothetical protein PHYPA_018870 [Physcomitrium patens]
MHYRSCAFVDFISEELKIWSGLYVVVNTVFSQFFEDVERGEGHLIKLSTSFGKLLQEELKSSQQEKELVYRRARLHLADEHLLQSVTSVNQLANMEAELEQALKLVRTRKSNVSSAYKAANSMQKQGEAALQDFMEQQTNTSRTIVPALKSREIGSQSGASPSLNGFCPRATSQFNLHNLGQMDELVGVNRSLQIYDTPLEQTDGQYEEQKKS